MNENALWSVEGLRMSIGRQILFDDASASIGANERLALIGRNGCGKSTFLRIVHGTEQPAGGKIIIRKNLRVSFMAQEFPDNEGKTPLEIVEEGFRDLPAALSALDRKVRCETVLEKLRVRSSGRMDGLSGGERRRVLLAQAIVSEPDLLLLDEPTNHLDVDTITWMEDFLSGFRGACLFVTHDRFFLDRIATRILELDHGHFYSCKGSYADFLEQKAEREYAEDLETKKRNAFLRREIEWVRRSPKARLKKNLGRVRRYEETASIQAPERIGDMELLLPDPPRLGNKVVDLKDVSLSLGGKMLFRNFSFEFTASSKVGIVGPNGTGKTSLLKVITGELPPDAGTVTTADTVRFNYIDQSRLHLNPDKTLREEVGGDSDYVDMGTDRITVRSYLRRFLFDEDRIRMQVKYLSGGEKARLILAKILRHGGNFLILDEPTNDLDLPSLRVLEEALADFPAAVAVVSHDRYFLNRVCNHILAFKPGTGEIFSSIGDYDSFSARLRNEPEAEKQMPAKQEKPSPPPRPAKARTKLSWAENRELESMETAVPEAERKIADLEAIFQDPDFFRKYGAKTVQMQAELEAARAECERLYVRWEELEDKKKRLENGEP